MKIVVTGAAGRLGRTIIGKLLNDPEVDSIIALDTAKFDFNSAKVESHKCDVCDKEIGRFFSECDVVIHLAFVVEISGGKNRDLINKINVAGSMNVFEAIAAAGVKQVIYTSSIAAYGINPKNDGLYLTEETETEGHPDFYYAYDKAEVEKWLKEFSPKHPNIRIAILRPSIFFSEIPKSGFFKNIFSRPRVVVIKGMDAPTHVTHGDDVAEACFLALKKRAHGKFNVASDEPISIEQMAKALGKPFISLPKFVLTIYSIVFRLNLVDIDPVWVNCFKGAGVLVSTEKIRKELGWEPRYKTTADVVRALST